MRNIFALWLISLLLVQTVRADRRRDAFKILEPRTFRADFETGSVGPWSSYPPAQDTAYDPTIWVKKIEGNPSLCLVREISAWTPKDYLFGVRKKLRLYLTRESLISFRFYLKSYGEAEEVIVKLGFGDGKSREIPVPVKKRMSWQDVQIRLGQDPDLTDPVRLDALAIMALCRRADPEAKLRLAVDDLVITGYEEKKIRIRKPKVHDLDELKLAVAGDHFQENQKLAVEIDVPVALKSAEIRLEKDWEGFTTASLKMKRESKNLWSAEVPGLEPGLWRANIIGRTAAGNSLESALVFLVRPFSSPPDHPFLLFTESGLTGIKEALRSGRTTAVWETVRSEAAAFREKFDPQDFRYNLDAYDEIFWLPTYEGYVRALHTPSRFIRENAIVYTVSGDRTAGEAARRALLAIASWPSFVHPHILNQGQFTYWPVGLALIDFALGYDMVYDLFTPEERKTVADALFHKGVTEVFKEYVRDNRVSSNTSNWISHVTGGGILCALAISREYSPAELEPYLTGMIVKLKEFIDSTFDPDGYYGEGYYYHNFAMQSLSHSLPALRNHFGLDYPKKVADSYQYILYQQNNETGRIYEFGDAHDDLIPSSMSNFAFILHSGGNPHLLWLYRQRPGNNYLDLLFPAPEGKGAAPSDLPLVKRLRRVGSVIFRSGFGSDDFVFITKCGPFFNHQHFDQGSFFLADRGELFIEECGNSNYYEDPWYPRLYIQAGGHNTLLTDSDIESQIAGDFSHDVPAWQNYARITEFLDWKEGAFLSADLAPVYAGKWKSLRRDILYLKPRTILLVDRGEGGSEATGLSLRIHPPRRDDLQVEGKIAKITRDGKALYIRTLAPEEYETRILKRPMSLNEFKAENPITMKARGFLELSTRPIDGKCTFINILGTEPEMTVGLKATKHTGFLEISADQGQYAISDHPGSLYKCGEFETDASVFGRISEALLVLHGTSLSVQGRPVLKAKAPASLCLVQTSREIRLDFSSFSGTEIELRTGKKPQSLLLGETSIRDWNYQNGLVAVRLPAGEGSLKIVF